MGATGEWVESVLLGRVQLGEQIGGGGEGEVYEIMGNADYLLKLYVPDDVSPADLKRLNPHKRQAYQSFTRIRFIKTTELQSLPLEYLAVNGGTPAYLMRKAPGKLLNDMFLFGEIKSLVLNERQTLGRALAHAITQLHSSQIVQSDIKPSNYIVECRNGVWVVYILDIDGGGYFGPQAQHFCPSTEPLRRYIAPELAQLNWAKLWKQFELRKQPDLWSLSVLLYQIIVDEDGPFPARPEKRTVAGYTPYHNEAVFDPQIDWPQSWQERQIEGLGLDAALVDRFTYVFSKKRFDVKRFPRPEAHDWRHYLDYALQHAGSNPYKARPVSSSNGKSPASSRVGGKPSGSFFDRVRRWLLNRKQRFVAWAKG